MLYTIEHALSYVVEVLRSAGHNVLCNEMAKVGALNITVAKNLGAGSCCPFLCLPLVDCSADFSNYSLVLTVAIAAIENRWKAVI